MAEGKVDLPEDLGPVKPTDEPWAAKADDTSAGLDASKVLMGFLDESKDQATSENSIPLSPQWLYAKPSEGKVGLSTTSGDTRPLNSLPQGNSLDSVHKDAWRLEGSQDKKEWRRNVPDVEINRRWREEERETGLLGRRERRKEGDRENEFRKNDRRSENISTREPADSRTLPLSDRWHDVSSRNSGNENRRDSKWSSRWGPEDKEKESRMEKKMDVDKEDPHIEKQSVGGNRPLGESDSREKWRPRHRQEVHSGGSAVYRAAPGFGLERGRVEGPNVGFTAGRGRSNFIGVPPFSRSSPAGPIGAAPIVKRESLHGKFSLSADTFRYPRGKLLDIYRKHKMPSTFDTTTRGFDDVPPFTQSCSVTPMAFVKPDSEEEAALDDIWKVKIASKEVYYDFNREKLARVSDCKIEPGSDVGEHNDNVNALSNGMDSGGITSTASKDDACCVPVFLTQSEQKVRQANVENDDGRLGLPDFQKDAQFGAVNSTASFDVSNNLTDGSDSLFDTSFIQESPGYNSQHQNSNSEIELSEQGARGELSLFYCDPQGEIQGPFLVEDIISWYDDGYFGTDLPVCLSDASESTPFRPLGEVFPKLSLRPQSNPLVNPGDQSDPSDNTKGNLDDTTIASEFSNSFPINGQHWASSGSEGPYNHQVQPIISEHEDSADSRFVNLPLSSSEISVGITGAERQSFNDFSGQDAGEVLHTERPTSSIQYPLGKLANNFHDLSRSSDDHQFLRSEMREANSVNHNLPTNNDLNPLGLSWSELERTHQKGPLSSNISGVSDHGFNPLLGGDASLFRHKQEEFNLNDDSSVVRDAWSSNYRRNPSSNVLQDAMDASHLSRFEPESAHFNLEEHLLYQQFQNQQLQQQRLLSPHQNVHLTDSFLDQLQGSVHHHQQSINHSMPDMEHLLKLQFEQQRHLQQLEQQQQLHQQQQQQQLHQQQQQMHQQQHQMQQQQRQMQLRQQQHQQQQHQLRLEQLLHQQLHEPSFGASHVDPLRGENSFDRTLYRQRLLHELQQQAHHLPRNHDPSLDQLIQAKFGHGLHRDHHNELLEAPSHPSHRHMSPMEQQLFLDLQQKEMQRRQFSIASRHQTAMEEERHIGGVWSVDESGQFIRAAATPHQTHSSRLGQLDYIQSPHRPPSIKQPSHLEQNFILHGQMQQGNYEQNVLPFESYAGTPGLDMDHLNALTRIQGMEMQEHGQMGQFPSGNRSHQHWMSNELSDSHISALERNWSEPNGQLRNSMIESQFAQLNLAAEKQKRDIKANLSIEDPNQWVSLVGNENSNHGLANLLHQKLVYESAQSLGLVNGAPTSSYESVDSSWLVPPLATDHSINLVADKVGLSDSFTDSSLFAKLGQAQERSVNINSEGKVTNFDGTGRLAFRSSSGALLEHKQFFSDMGELEREQLADSMVGDVSRERIDFSDVNEGKMVKKRGAKGISMSRSALDNLEGGIEQVGASIIDYGNLKVDVPIRHASFGSTGGGASLYNYDMGAENAYIDEMVKDRMAGIFSRGLDSSLSKRTHDPHMLSSQGALPELVSASSTTGMKGKNLNSFPYYEEGRRNPGGNLLLQVSETPSSSNKDMRFRRTSSYSEVNAQEASFMDMLKSTKKPVAEADGAAETADAGSGSRSSKKKGKKGRQIDPSLLGFKVHSNRILMGEIHRPDDC